MAKLSIFFEFIGFIKDKKKWFLFPIIAFLLLFGSIIVLSGNSAVAPFIYALF